MNRFNKFIVNIFIDVFYRFYKEYQNIFQTLSGKYNGGVVPEGLIVYEFSESEWIIFDCIGPIPEVLQSLNTKIFKEWLPNNIEYELSINFTIEWYDNGGTNDSNYHSAIWIPVKRK